MTSEPTASTARQAATHTAALQEARARRSDLHAGIMALERAVAAPAKGRANEWAAHVHDALVDLGAIFERHIAATEGPGRLFSEVTAHAPRLSNAVERLIRDHRDIRTHIGAALDTVRDLSGMPADEIADHGREAVLELLERLLRHRQTGADLVYEAYAVDIGVGD